MCIACGFMRYGCEKEAYLVGESNALCMRIREVWAWVGGLPSKTS